MKEMSEVNPQDSNDSMPTITNVVSIEDTPLDEKAVISKDDESLSEKSPFSDFNGSLENGSLAASEDDCVDEANMGYIPEESMTLQIIDEEEDDKEHPTNEENQKNIEKVDDLSPQNENSDDSLLTLENKDTEKLTDKKEEEILEEKDSNVKETSNSDDKDDLSSLSDEFMDAQNDETDEELEKEIDKMEVVSSETPEKESGKEKQTSEVKDSDIFRIEDDSNSNFSTKDDVIDEINKILDKDEENDAKKDKETEKNKGDETDKSKGDEIDTDKDEETDGNKEESLDMEVDKNKEISSNIDEEEIIQLEEENEEEEKKLEKKIDKTEMKEMSSSLKRKSIEYKSEEETDAKKPKIEKVETDFVTLADLKSFFTDKCHKMTRKTLEEFCTQKICEVIGQNSDLGKLRHQLALQEEFIKNYKSKVELLSKQVRDLEIVKCRLIQDMRKSENKNLHEIIPVKITRSVGLQVGLINNQRLSRPAAQNHATSSTVQVTTPSPLQSPAQRRVRNTLPQSKPVQRASPIKPTTPTKTFIKTPPPPKPSETKPLEPNSILNKALQKTPTPPAKVPPKTPENPPKVSQTIDLTDEEDVTKKQTPVITQTSTPTTSTVSNGAQSTSNTTSNTVNVSTAGNVRLVQPQVVTSASSVATLMPTNSRITYVMTSTGQNVGQQQLIAVSPGTAVRPGYRNVMLKPITQNNIGPRMGNIRQPTVSLPVTAIMTSQPINRGPMRFTAPTPRPPAPRTAQPTAQRQQMVRPNFMPRTQQHADRFPPSRARLQMNGNIRAVPFRHPAPLPPAPPLHSSQPHWKAMPPKPVLKISRSGDGIVLSWRILNSKDLSNYEEIASYQLYAYQENNCAPSTDMWRKVGDVKALALPMACTLTQFKVGNKYHFAVRAVDVKSRVGPFSQPEEIVLS